MNPEKYLPENYYTMSNEEIINHYKTLEFQQKMLLLCYKYRTVLFEKQDDIQLNKVLFNATNAEISINHEMLPERLNREENTLIIMSLNEISKQMLALHAYDFLKEKQVLTMAFFQDYYWTNLREQIESEYISK